MSKKSPLSHHGHMATASWNRWLQMAVRIVTVGLFFASRGALVMALLRKVLSCLFVALGGLVLVMGLVIWWFMTVA